MAAVGETAEKISSLSIKDGSSNADLAASAPNLQKNLSILSAEQVRSIVNCTCLVSFYSAYRLGMRNQKRRSVYSSLESKFLFSHKRLVCNHQCESCIS